MPEDLTEVLEMCLAEDGSPNKCLSKVRQIITNLLRGFRGKQGHNECSDQWCHWENAQTQPVEGISLCTLHGHEHVEQRILQSHAARSFI